MWATITRLSIGLAAIFCISIFLAGTAQPDTGTIAYYSNQEGVADIYLLDTTRGIYLNLTHIGSVTGFYSLSAEHLAYEVFNPVGDLIQIYVRALRCPNLFALCGGVRQVTHAARGSRLPVWSPDGRLLTFVHNVRYEFTDNEISVLDFETGDIRSFPYVTRQLYFLVWSPDSRQIMLVRDGDRYDDLRLVTLDGGETEFMQLAGIFDSSPVWSPDGSQLMYVTYLTAQRDLYIVNADGSNPRLLVANVAIGSPPVWSPDSRQIAYIATQQYSDHLYMIEVETGSIRSLAAGTFLYAHLTWSPDGRYIALNQFADGGEDIFMVEVDSGQMTRLTYSGSVGFPTWRP